MRVRDSSNSGFYFCLHRYTVNPPEKGRETDSQRSRDFTLSTRSTGEVGRERSGLREIPGTTRGLTNGQDLMWYEIGRRFRTSPVDSFNESTVEPYSE